jgi:hypothetical protein
MNLGLDLNDTITAFPQELRWLAKLVLDDGGEVHIITAIKKGNDEFVERKLKAARIPYTSIQTVYFEEYTDIAKLKLPVLEALKIDLYFDDNPAVNLLASRKGIMACLIQGSSHRGTIREY